MSDAPTVGTHDGKIIWHVHDGIFHWGTPAEREARIADENAKRQAPVREAEREREM